jgi:hypothetical protein
MNMRRRPTQQNAGGYNNQHRRNNHRSGGQNHGHNHNRPRKNYSALREKYLQQARDALSAGDRVLAENYFQHAEHCYRMMVEEGYNPNRQQPQPQQGEPRDAAAQNGQEQVVTDVDDIMPASRHTLPSFITQPHASHEPLDQAMAKEPVIVQNWEEN